MKKVIKVALLATGIVALGACAELQVYSEPELKTKTGIPFYISRPYLMVVRNGAKDTPLQASIVYLPDLAKPLYARIVPGMGSSKTQLTFTNSVLASVGQESDAQVDELIGSVGGLAESLATAGLTRQQTRELREEALDPATATAVASRLEVVAADLRKQEAQARAANVLTSLELTVLTTTAQVLDGVVAKLRDPAQMEAQLPAIIASLENAGRNWDSQIKGASAATAGEELTIRRQLAALRQALTEAVRTLKGSGGQEGGPTYELYEIDSSSGPGKTVLRRVPSE